MLIKKASNKETHTDIPIYTDTGHYLQNVPTEPLITLFKAFFFFYTTKFH